MHGERRHLRNVTTRALEKYLSTLRPEQITLEMPGTEALGAWFLGPVAENQELFERLVGKAIHDHATDRRTHFKGDPAWITKEIKDSPAYRDSVARLEAQFQELRQKLVGSVPFFSYRYQGHMLWDVTLPGMLAYFAAMLYNQNNVAAEASPVTTFWEMLVGDDLCRMLGYHIPKRHLDSTRGLIRFEKDSGKIGAWGHITCDGSVANIEAMWAARNLKCYPLAVAEALRRERSLAPARGLLVPLTDGHRQPLVELETWQLLNLTTDTILALPTRIQAEYGVPAEALETLKAYTIQELGFAEFNRRFSDAAGHLVVLAPATAHYSWPKAAALLGMGKRNLIALQVDLDARMGLSHLRTELDQCLADRRPVVMVVAVLGTTEEGAVDPLEGILALRAEYRQAGLEFVVHVDAAWGGYFASMMRPPLRSTPAPTGASKQAAWITRLRQITPLEEFCPELAMSGYVKAQYKALSQADSITVDPHKAGYIPYPAGGLCYRNSAMRHLVAFSAPVVYHGDLDPTVGVYGIEGSKPGAAAAATYLSHRVIRPDQSGYGRILGRCMFNSKRFYAALVTMGIADDETGDEKDFVIKPFQRLPAERTGASDREIKEELRRIRSMIVNRSNEALLADPVAMQLLRELGSDQVIIAYAFNFFETNGELNGDVKLLNQLNRAIFHRLSVLTSNDGAPKPPLFVTASNFDPKIYGRELVESFMRRLGVVGDPDVPIEFLISTTMDPWLTDTAEGNFIPTLIKALREEVLKAIKKVREDGGRP